MTLIVTEASSSVAVPRSVALCLWLVLPMIRLLAVLSLAALPTVALSTAARADETRAKELWKLCSSCHGPDGGGTAMYHAPSIAGLPAWYLEAQLIKFNKGVRGGTHPGDLTGMRMRPIARMLDDNDIKLMTNYVAGLKRPVPPDTVPRTNLVQGEKTFQTCKACHGNNGEGNQELHAPPLVNQNDWYLLVQLDHFKRGVRGFSTEVDVNGATMAGIASALSEEQIKNVVGYINALKPDSK